LLHPLSLASRVLRLFQLTPSHIEEALALVALTFITVASIAVAFIVEQRYAVEWLWALELLRSVLVPPEPTELIAADTIRIDRARALVAVIERSLTAAPIHRSGAGVGFLSGSNAPGLRGRNRLEAIVFNPPRTMSGWGQSRQVICH
jgi:hypothetical protein